MCTFYSRKKEKFNIKRQQKQVSDSVHIYVPLLYTLKYKPNKKAFCKI